jgi:hypothetical protein
VLFIASELASGAFNFFRGGVVVFCNETHTSIVIAKTKQLELHSIPYNTHASE